MTDRCRKYKRIKTKLRDDDEDERVRSNVDDDVGTITDEMRVADSLTSETAEFLANLIIELRHDVLPQHQVESVAGTRAPSEQEQRQFREHEPRYKKGVFTPEEDQIIVNNWKAFCKMHGWSSSDPKPFLFHRHRNHFYMPKLDERKKFVQFLADGLPYRSLYSVYHRFRNLYDPHKVNKYNANEDEYIIKYIEENRNIDTTRRFADLAKVLKRTRASVWRRYKLLRKKRGAGEESD